MTILIIVALAWAVCGIIAFGLELAHFQRRYPILAEREYATDRRFAFGAAAFGPIAIITHFTNGGWWELMYRNPHKRGKRHQATV